MDGSQPSILCSFAELITGATSAMDDVQEVLHQLEQSLIDAMYESEEIRKNKPAIQQIDLIIQYIDEISRFLATSVAELPTEPQVDAGKALAAVKVARVSKKISKSLNHSTSDDALPSSNVGSISMF